MHILRESVTISFELRGLLAQLVEHRVHIAGVTGSSPVQTTSRSLERAPFSIAEQGLVEPIL